MGQASARLRVLRAGFRALAPMAPKLAAEYAERLFCRPPPREIREAEAAFLATGRRGDIRTGTDTLAAWQWGTQGPLAILLHGWGSRAARWHPLVPALVEDGFQVLAYDQPAHGQSSGQLASLPQFIRAFESVVGRLGQAPALVVGHSLGGSAAAIALHRGVSAGRVVLLSAPSEQREYAERFARTVGLPDEARDLMTDNLSRRLGFTWSDLDLPALVSSVKVPALVIHDRQDLDVGFSHAERIVAAWPGAELLATSGTGHSGALEDDTVIERIRTFAAAAR
ncbi:MAG TPA: alpha/beta fold hydrolase [Gemmatimonadales bacterium]|nr:alpha/beta fold hydrolase [Gemmatimonadales bacterium]